MPPQNILISLRFAPLHQDILHRWLDKRQYSIYTEKGKRATDLPLLPQSRFSAVDCFYRDLFAEPISRENRFGFCEFSDHSMVAFDGIRRIYYLPDLLRVVLQ
mgnify:CR=1 FL=1